MKIALVDTATDGHHICYLNALTECDGDFVAIVPQKNAEIKCRQFCVDACFTKTKKLLDYIKWSKGINKILKAEKPDIVHYLYGDSMYRYFGKNLWGKRKRVTSIITIHQIRRGKLKDLGNKLIANSMNKTVVHTESLMETLRELGINNGVHIEYPKFSETIKVEQSEALRRLGISKREGKILLALGGTRYDKGLDILLEALKNVEESFQLLIAGEEQTFKKDFIEKEIESYKDKVNMILRVLSDEEFALCLNAADIVVLPYRKMFDGASGPLGEGVALGKMIIGPSHGSIGETIKNNSLGLTFEAEKAENLAETIDKMLKAKPCIDEKYKKYQTELSPHIFIKKYDGLYSSIGG